MALKDLMKEDLKEVEEAGAKVKPEPFFVGALKQRYSPFFAISYQAIPGILGVLAVQKFRI
jgi:hypothetical protein